MATYTGLFIRDVVGQTATGPQATSWTDSPDILCNGTEPLPNPALWTDPGQYAVGLPAAQTQNPLRQNYVYVRGINATDGPQTSTIYLYYVDTTIVLWPQNWKWDSIMQNNVLGQNWVTLTANRLNDIVGSVGGIGGIQPFFWTPPRENVHYCLVAWASNGPDQLTPPDLYDIGSVADMGHFILTHPNVGWRNTIEVDKTQPTIQNSSTVSGGTAGGYLNIGVQCQNLPTDGLIEFSVPGPDGANTIIFKGPILSPYYAPTVQVKYPPNFSSTLTFTYTQGATPIPDGANIIPLVGSPIMSTDYISFASQVAPHLIADVHHYGTPDELKANLFRNIPPRKLLIVGSVPFKLV